LPSVNRLHAELRGQGLEVLLVNFRENPDVVRETVRERGYRPRVLLDESGDVTGRVYGVWGPPTAYVVDRRGRLVGRVVGPRDFASPAALAFFRALLASKSPSE
jgi:hypothetical protein